MLDGHVIRLDYVSDPKFNKDNEKELLRLENFADINRVMYNIVYICILLSTNTHMK